MSSDNILDKVKKLRELTGVGFKDCKNAIDQNNGDIEKSIEFLRKKGIAKANKKMERIAAEGLVSLSEDKNSYSMIEINCETDFVAKNNEFIKFVEDVSAITLKNIGKMDKILESEMKNKKKVKDNLVTLISKIGEKITIRRSDYVSSKSLVNFSYVHSAVKENLGKIGVVISLKTNKKNNEIMNFGKQLAMQVAALSPISIEEKGLDKNIIEKEKEIIIEELKNNGKKPEISNKIAEGKLKKFIAENTLLNQDWVIDPKKKVKDVLKEVAGKDKIEVIKFIRFKVGEGV